MEECRTLREYAQYVDKVRRYSNEMELNTAVERAVSESIQEGILKEFLQKNRAEVVAMSIFEYNEEEGKKETQGKNFDKVLAEAKSKWNKAVSSISVNGTEEVKELFYTSLYRTLIHPSVYMDVDGRYRGIDHSIHNAEHFTNYTIFSLWDTFRALHPLINLIDA